MRAMVLAHSREVSTSSAATTHCGGFLARTESGKIAKRAPRAPANSVSGRLCPRAFWSPSLPNSGTAFVRHGGRTVYDERSVPAAWRRRGLRQTIVETAPSNLLAASSGGEWSTGRGVLFVLVRSVCNLGFPECTAKQGAAYASETLHFQSLSEDRRKLSPGSMPR